MPIPKIIHTCLMGGYQPSALGERCMKSWRRILPDYEIRIWNDDNVPQSDWCKEASRKKAVNASHWAQWRVLLDHGGIFLDVDIELVRPFDLSPAAFVGFQRADISDNCINNAVVGAVPDHPLVRKVLARIEESDPAGWPLTTGPGILTDALVELGMSGLNVEQQVGDVLVYDRERFYPYFHDEDPLDADAVGPRTFAIHRWEGSWTDK